MQSKLENTVHQTYLGCLITSGVSGKLRYSCQQAKTKLKLKAIMNCRHMLCSASSHTYTVFAEIVNRSLRTTGLRGIILNLHQVLKGKQKSIQNWMPLVLKCKQIKCNNLCFQYQHLFSALSSHV